MTDNTWPPYLTDPAVRDALELAYEVAQWNEDKLFGLVLDAPEPNHMAGVAFCVVQEHQKAVIKLVQLGAMASATALMRPTFEAYVRGVWPTIADDQQLAQFQKGQQSSDPEKLIKQCIKKTGRQRYTDLLETWRDSKPSLHGFVHNSYQSLIRRAGLFDVPPAEVVMLLQFSTSMSLYAGFETLELAQAHPPHDQVHERPAFVAARVEEVLTMLDRMGLVHVNPEPAMPEAT